MKETESDNKGIDEDHEIEKKHIPGESLDD